jgi:hypothetical protein
LWIKRYREAGLAGICERSRRLRTFPAQTPWQQEEWVIALRLQYPDWGARKLGVVLGRDGVKLTRSTIHRILLRYDLVRDRDRDPQAVKRFERERPNELWQMDFKGPKNWPHAVGPLSVIDDHSRYLVALRATGTLDVGLVREQLEQAFERCGVPDAMLMDHGTPWWNWQSFSGHTQRRYDPDPPPWEYPEGAWTLKVDCQGTVDLHGQRWRIGKTLAGERVMIQPVEDRFLVFFCSTPVREIDPATQRSTIVERWIEEQNLPKKCKGCVETQCKGCPGT